MEGACWDADKRCLIEHNTSNKMYDKLPILAIIPIETHLLRLPKSSIKIPVYVTSNRENSIDHHNFVFEANFDTSLHKSFWILRGICIVMNYE